MLPIVFMLFSALAPFILIFPFRINQPFKFPSVPAAGHLLRTLDHFSDMQPTQAVPPSFKTYVPSNIVLSSLIEASHVTWVREILSHPVKDNSIQASTAYVPTSFSLSLCLILILAITIIILLGLFGRLVYTCRRARPVFNLNTAVHFKTSPLIPDYPVIYPAFTNDPIISPSSSSSCPLLEYSNTQPVVTCANGILPVGSPQLDAIQHGIRLGFSILLPSTISDVMHDSSNTFCKEELKLEATLPDPLEYTPEYTPKHKAPPILVLSPSTNQCVSNSAGLRASQLHHSISNSGFDTQKPDSVKKKDPQIFETVKSPLLNLLNPLEDHIIQALLADPTNSFENQAEASPEPPKPVLVKPRIPKAPKKAPPKYPPKMPRPVPAPNFAAADLNLNSDPDLRAKMLKKPPGRPTICRSVQVPSGHSRSITSLPSVSNNLKNKNGETPRSTKPKHPGKCVEVSVASLSIPSTSRNGRDVAYKPSMIPRPIDNAYAPRKYRKSTSSIANNSVASKN